MPMTDTSRRPGRASSRTWSAGDGAGRRRVRRCSWAAPSGADRHLWAGVGPGGPGAAAAVALASRPGDPAGRRGRPSQPGLSRSACAHCVRCRRPGRRRRARAVRLERGARRQAADYHACLLLIVAGHRPGRRGQRPGHAVPGPGADQHPDLRRCCTCRGTTTPAQEAALKYFLLSVFSSALLLFGFSYLYGLTGTTNLPAMLQTLQRRRPSARACRADRSGGADHGRGRARLPHHGGAVPLLRPGRLPGDADRRRRRCWRSCPRWPASSPCSACSASCCPPGSCRRRRSSALALSEQVPILFWILAAITMTLGNVLALLQDNLKRLLAYSSVAHAGYMLIALAVGAAPARTAGRAADGVEALLFYLVAYGAMTHRRLRACSRYLEHAGAAGRDGRRPRRPEPQPSRAWRC